MFQKSDEFFGTYRVLRGSKSFTYQKFLISECPFKVLRKFSPAWSDLGTDHLQLEILFLGKIIETQILSIGTTF